MVPTPELPGDAAGADRVGGEVGRGDGSGPPPGAVAPRLSPEAAWGMRAVIMVLLFLLRWVGRGPAPVDDPPVLDAAAPATTDTDRAARAARVAGGAASGTPETRAPGDGLDDAAASATAVNRRRAVYASALTAAGTAAWIAGRRSGRRR